MELRKLILMATILLSSCIEQQSLLPTGTELLKNTDFSSSMDNVSPWIAVSSPGFNLGVSDTVFRSGSRSIFIENTDIFNENSGNWTQVYNGPIPGPGQRVRLRAHLKGENIRLFTPNSNVFISLRFFPVQDSGGSLAGRFISSQQQIRVDGTFDWRPIELVVNSVPEDVESVAVFLVMGPRVTGKVYFDDVTLTVD
ncbi:MAG: hypothetical protein ACXIUQ_19270 [Cecembia sp.]